MAISGAWRQYHRFIHKTRTPEVMHNSPVECDWHWHILLTPEATSAWFQVQKKAKRKKKLAQRTFCGWTDAGNGGGKIYLSKTVLKHKWVVNYPSLWFAHVCLFTQGRGFVRVGYRKSSGILHFGELGGGQLQLGVDWLCTKRWCTCDGVLRGVWYRSATFPTSSTNVNPQRGHDGNILHVSTWGGSSFIPSSTLCRVVYIPRPAIFFGRSHSHIHTTSRNSLGL